MKPDRREFILLSGGMVAESLLSSVASTASQIQPRGSLKSEVTKVSAMIRNERVLVSFDLKKGTYRAIDIARNSVILEDCSLRCACSLEGDSSLRQFSAKAPGAVHTCQTVPVADALGMGDSLLVASHIPGGPTLLLQIILYQDPMSGFVSLRAGLENTTDQILHLTSIIPLDDARAFAGFDIESGYSTLDGYSGGPPTSVLHQATQRESLNNMLVTFGKPGAKRSLVLGGLSYEEFEKQVSIERTPGVLRVRLLAEDPIGKRIDPHTRYLVAGDRFYIDFLTDNPFDALEVYANCVRLAQEVLLPVCSFPIIDTWFAQVPHFGSGILDPQNPERYANGSYVDPAFLAQARTEDNGYGARNDSVGAVEEMECDALSGFLKYSGTVGILLEPDLYATANDPNNQQLWWDDQHWQRGPGNRINGAPAWKSSNGQFTPPYETARKWMSAVKSLGGIPMIYVQTGFRSQDYADQFPEQMIFQRANAPSLNEKGQPQYSDSEKKILRKLGPDYTNPDFIAHVRQVWENLRKWGLQGVKFDYPDYPFTGWPTMGGLKNPYATTAMHYRNVFKLAKDGLGPEAFIHERALTRGSDVTVGLSTSQRTEGDTDLIDASMVSKTGLRWYKNRVILNYDMDGKNPFHVSPSNRDGMRAMLTMSYVVSGSLIIVPSIGRWTDEMMYDISRIFPFHSERKSARPVDAFSSTYPSVYDYQVNEDWHQLTFYNTSFEEPSTTKPIGRTGQKRQLIAVKEMIVGVDLSGDTAFGGLGLDPAKEYYIHDFWNDHLIGIFKGRERFEQTLRPGEARMMSVRAVQSGPQFISSNRHVMQGLIDHLGCEWNPEKKELRGVSLVIGGETYQAIIASNGWKPVAVTVDESIEQSLAKSRVKTIKHPASASLRQLADADGLTQLSLDRPNNGPVAWTMTFERA
jgi:hypothetical protein